MIGLASFSHLLSDLLASCAAHAAQILKWQMLTERQDTELKHIEWILQGALEMVLDYKVRSGDDKFGIPHGKYPGVTWYCFSVQQCLQRHTRVSLSISDLQICLRPIAV